MIDKFFNKKIIIRRKPETPRASDEDYQHIEEMREHRRDTNRKSGLIINTLLIIGLIGMFLMLLNVTGNLF